MARTGLSETDVAEAALKLAADGHPVTLTNVRREIGRGSYTTIRKHLDSLDAKEPGRRKEVDKVPAEFRVICDAHASRVWRALQKHMDVCVQTAVKPYQRRMHALITQLREAKLMRERLEWEEMRIRNELHKSELAVHNVSRELEQVRQELAVERALRTRTSRASAHLNA